MNIAVATDGDTLYGEVSEEFNLCKFLLIINMDDMKFTAIENEGDTLGEVLARKINEYNCEAVITGKLTPQAFDIITDNCVTRYDGRGHSVKEALVLMDQYALELIRNLEGSDHCDHTHSADNCGGIH